VRLLEAIERAVVNGRLLQLRSGPDGASNVMLLVSSADNRDRLARLLAGDGGDAGALGLSSVQGIELYRPNVYALYERWIGPLTPLTAEELRDAEQSFPRHWLELALREAAESGHHSWRYARSILARWEQEGGPPAPFA
jgi:DnaD/phage-associated family protein